MRLMDLFEFDPRVAKAMGDLGYGGQQVGTKLSQPVKLTKEMSFVADHLEGLQQYIEKNPGIELPQAFDEYMAGLKKKYKLTSLGIKYVPNKLLSGNKPNSAYIRQILGAVYKSVNQQVKQQEKDKISGVMKPVDPRAGDQSYNI